MTPAADSPTAIAPAASPSAAADSSAWPPGFRFHPTDEELVLYYLKRKICRRRLRLNIISELDVYKWDPQELPGQSLLKTGDRQWFFFSPRDRKYPNAARSNRATRQGYWKATGKDRNISSCSRAVGVKKTLVFYKGRAPSGERTDWVMHEYTLDEEELKRCQNAQDYYALYKVFKKSGPGPKNGEQYGAPFREDEWADDDCFDAIKVTDTEFPVEQPPVISCNAKAADVDPIPLRPPLNDIEEFFNDLEDLQDLDQVLGDGDGFVPLQICLEEEEESRSTLADPPSMPGQVALSEPPYSLNTNAGCYDMPPIVNDDQLGSSEWQLKENSVITNAAENCTLESQRNEDFLEIDDLALFQNMESTGKLADYVESDGFGDIDVFQDAAMFLRDIGSVDQGNIAGHSFGDNIMNGGYYGLQPSQFDDADQSCSQLWDHEQRLGYSTSTEPVRAVFEPQSGPVSDTANLLNESSPIQWNDDSGAVSRLSSALWAFVESIPTTPASASESTLVNRALERMSSFSRVRINSAAANSSDGSGSAVVRAGRSRRCFLTLYVLAVIGVLCGVLVGSLRLWGTSAS
ncbi:hypothetical protein MLD38_034055 [Melastoma candidum]|uniref:Uncharacterized protein n=1 Tax=Melastoma candidum TaxID=119954 RepID=A0ACB9M8H9_9MYRT|nr:hypothetical protein MLD38_034055 [Melastoma candidum]